MKRVTALILILIFTYNIMGGYLLIMLQRHHIRREMVQDIKKGISASELTSVTMTSKNKNDFNWIDKNEFKYKGVMYDVVKTEKVNSLTTVYHCLTDHLEMNLLAKLEAQKNKNSKQDKNNTLKQIIKIVFKDETKKQEQGVILANSNKSIIIRKVNFYDSLTPEITSPPPNYI